MNTRTSWKYASLVARMKGKVCPVCGGEPYETKSKLYSYDYSCLTCYRAKRNRSHTKHREQELAFGRDYNKMRKPQEYDYKRKAKAKVAGAVRSGVLVRLPCEVCETTVNVHGHHDDYSKPLDVRWLCIAHHKEHHANEQRKAKVVPKHRPKDDTGSPLRRQA